MTSAPQLARGTLRSSLPATLKDDPELRDNLSLGFDAAPSPAAAAMAVELADALGESAIAVIHYGSRARGVDARADSAYDFMVIVDAYRPAYESLTRAMHTGVSARTATTLAHVLAPNVHAIPPVPEGGKRNKCGVLTLRELRYAAKLNASDHFVIGRLFQHVQLLWTKDAASEATVREQLAEIRLRTFEWVRCFLPPTFTTADYCRSLLTTSFAGEVRPEAGERPAQLFEAQRDVLLPVYTSLLEALHDADVLTREGDVYRQVHQPSAALRRRWEWYFRKSKARGTLRWGKAVVQYDGWLEYIVQKITRHNNVQVQLTERERRWPFIFLWPKIFVFFRDRSRWETRK